MNYFIHDNGWCPFKVNVDDEKVKVFKFRATTLAGEVQYETEPILEFHSQKTFIGKSPLNRMTQFSGGHGPEYDGNSILVQTTIDNYVFIGREIYSFPTKNQIVEFVSPVGNSDVPYPYARDSMGNYYLFIEDAVVENNEDVGQYDNAYDYYYEHALITSDEGCVPPILPKIDKFHDICEFYINDENFTLKYTADPEANFDFMVTMFGHLLFTIDIHGNKTFYDKKSFGELIRSFGQLKGFSQLHKRMLQPRLE